MVVISPGATIPTDLAVFYTTDPTLSSSPIFAFYGASATSIANPANNSRVQCHVFTSAGLRSYPRLAISPSSPLYQAVSCLSREEQGDQVCRGLAFALLKYFSEIPETAKDIWKEKVSTSSRSPPKLFSETHAASLASRMQQLSRGKQLIEEVNAILAAQALSCLDAEVILPPGSIRVPAASSSKEEFTLQDDDLGFRYGKYASLVKLFGEPLFLPTSKVRRAPSKTSPMGHGTIVSTNQMMKLKSEIHELVETEERYVNKINDLVGQVAEDFCLAAESERDIQTCNRLFPKCLDEIRRLNTSFLDECSLVLEHIESSTEAHTKSDTQPSDATIMHFSKCCLKWFPKFSKPYTEYISAHAGFGEYVKELAGQQDSAMGRVMSAVGERKLMSLLIEPIQRLPRYNLYLDNMIKRLPPMHPAVKLLLASKDIVAEICAHESASADDLRVARLRSMITSWPTDFPSSTRLVAAVDVVELKLPYINQRPASPASGAILLLFTNCVVLLERYAETTISSRILLAEIDQPLATQRHSAQNSLKCTAWWMLSTVNTSEFDNGTCIVLSPAHTQSTPTMKMQHDRLSASTPQNRVFRLSGHYEGKASRWSAEVGKARLEDRYSEATRESPKWDARSFEPGTLGLGLLTAIVEESSEHVLHDRPHHAALRIVVEPSLHKSTIKSSQGGNEIVARITTEDQGWSRLEVEVANDRATTDHIFTTEILPVLIRRVTNAVQMRYQMRNPAAVHCLHHYNDTILRSLEIRADEPTRSRSHHRSHSPVKAFTSLFSSASSRDLGRDMMMHNTPVLENMLRFQSSTSPPEIQNASPSRQVMPVEQDLETIEKPNERKVQKNPLAALESTLNSYVVALLARKGNVVGKVVARRHLASEAEVNELYNVLLDDPDNLEHAAQVSIDVLFASFEKFLKTAWQEKMGAIVDRPVIEHLESMYMAHNLGQQFSQAIRRLAPQNQRALRTIIDLLGQLLSSMGHDEDKGLLTEAFADMLITDGDPRDFIPLLDQLMSDDVAHQNAGSVTSQTPAAKAYPSGSFSSKAASISKRFGFGSVRKENKQPDISFTGSLRRTWSKGKSSESVTAMNVFTLHSSPEESGVVSATRYQTPQEPRTHDVINGGHVKAGLTLDPISVSPFIADLDPFTSTPSPVRTLPISTLAARSPNSSSPTNSSPTKQPRPRSMYASTAAGSPLKHTPELTRALTVRVKPKPIIDATSPIIEGYHTMRERPAQLDLLRASPEHNDVRKSKLPLSCTPERQIPKLTPSPGLRGILCERNDSGNTPPRQQPSPIKQVAASAASPTKKLRIKSPTKPREQLLTIEGPAAQPGTEANFRCELSSITTTLADISSLNQSTELGSLAARLKALESSLPSFSNTPAITTSQTVPSSSPAPSSETMQQRLTDLETQLATAHAENSALYSRTNKELMAVFEQVRAGRGVEELMKKLTEEQKEARKWRDVARKLLRERRTAGQIVKEVGVDMVKEEKVVVPEDARTENVDKADVEIKTEELPEKLQGNRENVRPSPTRLPFKTRAEDKEKTMSMLGRGRPRLVNPGL